MSDASTVMMTPSPSPSPTHSKTDTFTPRTYEFTFELNEFDYMNTDVRERIGMHTFIYRLFNHLFIGLIDPNSVAHHMALHVVRRRDKTHVSLKSIDPSINIEHSMGLFWFNEVARGGRANTDTMYLFVKVEDHNRTTESKVLKYLETTKTLAGDIACINVN